jgi:hypothetical protein
MTSAKLARNAVSRRKLFPSKSILRLPSSTTVPTPVGVRIPPNPKPPARIRSMSVPCGTSSTTILLGNHLLLRFWIEANVASYCPTDQTSGHQLADSSAGHCCIVGDYG